MGTVTKVVIDTNVFISAFGWDGKPEAVFYGSYSVGKIFCLHASHRHSSIELWGKVKIFPSHKLKKR